MEITILYQVGVLPHRVGEREVDAIPALSGFYEVTATSRIIQCPIHAVFRYRIGLPINDYCDIHVFGIRTVRHPGHFQPYPECSPSISVFRYLDSCPVGVLQYGFEHVVGIRQVPTPTRHCVGKCMDINLFPSGLHPAPVFGFIELGPESIHLIFVVAQSRPSEEGMAVGQVPYFVNGPREFLGAFRQ